MEKSKRKEISRELRHLFVYALAFGYMIFFAYIVWTMFFAGTPNVIILANEMGEYWLEFFLINFLVILLGIYLIKQVKDYMRSGL